MMAQHKGRIGEQSESSEAIDKILITLKKIERITADQRDEPYKLPYSTPPGKKSQWKVTRKA